jgi:hypothetical protein
MRASPFAILIAIAAGMMAILGLEFLFRDVLSQVLLLVVLLLLVMALGVVLRPERRVPLISDPFVLCCGFLAQFYVVGPIVMAIWGLSPIAFFRRPTPRCPLTAGILMVGCALLGYRMGLGSLIAGRLPDFPATARKLPRAWFVTTIVTAGLAGCFGWIEYQGGLLAKLGLSYGAGKSGAIFTLAFNAVVLGTVLWAWVLMDGRSRMLGRTLFFSTLLLEVLFFGVIYGVRKYLFFLFFGLLTTWSLRRGVRSLPKVRTAITVVVLLLFFSVWGSLRAIPVAEMLGIGEDSHTTRTNEFQYGYLAGVGDPFGTACLVFEIFPGQEAFRHGSTLLVRSQLHPARGVARQAGGGGEGPHAVLRGSLLRADRGLQRHRHHARGSLPELRLGRRARRGVRARRAVPHRGDLCVARDGGRDPEGGGPRPHPHDFRHRTGRGPR